MLDLKTREILLSIVIVNYNNKELLKNCIDSIYSNSIENNYEIIVVDNASKDNSRELITKLFPEVIWVQNETNTGFATANNQGFKISKGSICMLLNNDTIILKDALDKLVQYMANNNEIGAVGPRILNADGSLQKSCRRAFPTFLNSFGYFTKLYKLMPSNKKLGSYVMSYKSDLESHEVEALSGAAMMVRKEILMKLDGLDENYFMHFEDVDLCLRIYKSGYKLFYVHDAEIIHLKGQSSKLRSNEVIDNFNNSLLYYYKKNYSKEKNFCTNSLVYFFVFTKKLLSKILYRIKNKL